MDILVLVGPNGVGKSTIGRALGATGVYQYLDLEAFFVEQCGTLSAYRAARGSVYAQFESSVRAAMANEHRPVVFEEVLLNDAARAMLAALERDYNVVMVNVSASRDTCLRRAAARTEGVRFPKTEASVGEVWDRFSADAVPSSRSMIAIDTERETISAVVDRFVAMSTGRKSAARPKTLGGREKDVQP